MWAKRTDVHGARYAASRQVDPYSTVDEFIARFLELVKVYCDPSLVGFRLVKHGPGGVPTAEQDADALENAASLLADPSQTLVQAGVTDGSWLLAVFAGGA